MPSDTVPLSPSETEAVMRAIKGPDDADIDPNKIPISVNRQRMDRLKKQAELSNLGSVGKIKRR